MKDGIVVDYQFKIILLHGIILSIMCGEYYLKKCQNNEILSKLLTDKKIGTLCSHIKYPRALASLDLSVGLPIELPIA